MLWLERAQHQLGPESHILQGNLSYLEECITLYPRDTKSIILGTEV